ncbi:hypothetical protein QBC39DRAFT_333463 [Podospora conica]|nr:hypothetical protein QBC39DRAFT_333463 [Schizothecium conicum]
MPKIRATVGGGSRRRLLGVKAANVDDKGPPYAAVSGDDSVPLPVEDSPKLPLSRPLIGRSASLARVDGTTCLGYIGAYSRGGNRRSSYNSCFVRKINRVIYTPSFYLALLDTGFTYYVSPTIYGLVIDFSGLLKSPSTPLNPSGDPDLFSLEETVITLNGLEVNYGALSAAIGGGLSKYAIYSLSTLRPTFSRIFKVDEAYPLLSNIPPEDLGPFLREIDNIVLLRGPAIYREDAVTAIYSLLLAGTVTVYVILARNKTLVTLLIRLKYLTRFAYYAANTRILYYGSGAGFSFTSDKESLVALSNEEDIKDEGDGDKEDEGDEGDEGDKEDEGDEGNEGDDGDDGEEDDGDEGDSDESEEDNGDEGDGDEGDGDEGDLNING